MPNKPEPRIVAPTLDSITVKGKYILPESDFTAIDKKIRNALGLSGWVGPTTIGESSIFYHVGHTMTKEIMKIIGNKKMEEIALKRWLRYLERIRPGSPVYLSIVSTEHLNNAILVEVECRPNMWYRISQLLEKTFRENQVQEALLECKGFVKQVMSIFRGKEVEPVSVYPAIPRMEVKSRLLNLGLEEVVDGLDKAEVHIVQNLYSESLKSSRTAFEKMIDWQMKKRGLEDAKSYHNNLDRLKSKGYLDPETTKLLQAYYQCLSLIGVHEKGVPPGIYEAQMGYGITLIMLGYFADKLP